MKASKFYERIGANIRTRREFLGLTQEVLANEIDCARVSVSNIESGRQCISVRRLLAFAEALGTTPTALLRGTEKLW